MSLGSQVFPGTTALSVLLLLMTASGTAAPPAALPLHDAINDGDWDGFTGLLQAGHDPNEVDEHGQTALHFALVRLYGRGYLYVSELLNFGADPDAKDRTGATALHHAAMIGWPAIASLLLRNGADVHARSHGGGSPLGSAYIHGYMDIVRLLESYGARIDIEAKRRQLMAVGLINAVVRRCARKTKDDTAERRTACIARALHEMREKHGLYDHLSDDGIRRIAREEGSTTDTDVSDAPRNELPK